MRDDLDFRVLGPLEILVGGEPGPRLPPIRKRLLAALLARAGRQVTVDELVDVLWTGSPPPSAVATLHVHLHRLRQALRDEGHITRGAGGYQISVTAAEFDVPRFDDLYERARTERHTGRSAAAAATLERALELWRGEPYTGIEPSVHITAEVVRLNERRLIAEQALNETRLDTGWHHELIAPLTELAEAHPYVERFGILLMIALYRAGRQVEALEVFRARRRLLVDELGVEPGALLQRVHKAVLRGDDRLKTVATAKLHATWEPVPAPPVTAGAASEAVPRELPTPPHCFTGREDELRQLGELLDGTSAVAAPVPIAVIAGMGGIGKTALAVHWAHHVAEHFPDGQLFIDLRGHSGSAALEPLEALTALLDSLGVSDKDLPTETDRVAARFRTETVDKRVLILLDNAATADQVRPLLPGGSGSLVLVTSRDRLSDLTVRHGGRRLTLDPLRSEEAQSLIVSLQPEPPARVDRTGITALADLCGRLPLALRIAAANLADRPRHDVQSYVAQLSGGDRLASLQVDDGDAALRTVFDSSYRAIPPDARRLFRLIALVPGTDLTVEAAAALAGASAARIEPVLDRLVSAHLVDRHRPGRFRLHDLIRLYAGERADAEETPAELASAVGRLLHWYLHRADACRNLRYGGFTALTPPTYEGERFEPDASEAMAWLTAERANLGAAVEYAAEHGPHEFAWLLNDALGGFMWLGTHGAEALGLARTALAAAEKAGDLPGQSASELSLAWTLLRSNRSAESIEHGERAEGLAVRADWLPGQAAAGRLLAYAYASVGRLPQARDHAMSALRASRILGGEDQITILEALGGIHLHLGDLDISGEYFLEQLRATVESGLPVDAAILVNLSGVHLFRGRLDLAWERLSEVLESRPGVAAAGPFTGHHRQAARFHVLAGRLDDALASAQREFDELGEHPDRRREAATFSTLAAVRDARGEHRKAIALFDRALELTAEGSFFSRVESMVGRSAALLHLGELVRARAAAAEAIEAARDYGYRIFEGQALNLIAEAELGLGETEAAARHAEAALRLNGSTGHVPGEAESLRILADLGESDDAEAARSHRRRARELRERVRASAP